MGANGFRRCGCANLDRSRCPGWITDGRIVHAWARAVVVLLHGGPQSPAYDGSAPFFLGPKLHIGICGQSSARPLTQASCSSSAPGAAAHRCQRRCLWVEGEAGSGYGIFNRR
jgi:hypothetical protein